MFTCVCVWLHVRVVVRGYCCVLVCVRVLVCVYLFSCLVGYGLEVLLCVYACVCLHACASGGAVVWLRTDVSSILSVRVWLVGGL